MKKIIINIIAIIILIVVILGITACGSVQTTTTTRYDATGAVMEKTVVESDSSDFAALVASSDGNATTLSADITKFGIGYSGWGINFLSVSGMRVKAPVNTRSNSAEALDKTALILEAKKTTIQTGNIGVNTAMPPSASSELAEVSTN